MKGRDTGTLRDEEEGKAGWNIKIEDEEGGGEGKGKELRDSRFNSVI